MKKPKKKTVMKVLCVVYAVISFALLALALLIRYAADWSHAEFGEIPFSQIVFHLKAPLTGSGSDIVWNFIEGALKYILPVFIPCLIFYLLRFLPDIKPKFKIAGKEISFSLFRNRLFRIIRASVLIFVAILFGTNTVYAMKLLNMDDYLEYMKNSTNIYEEYYVDANNIEITAPENKKNLIYIFCESMETSYGSKECGGAWEESLIPNLTELALANESFSEKGTLNGAMVTANCKWTAAGMVAQTAGVPINTPLTPNDLGANGIFLPGAVSIGEILKDNGYNNMIMFGSDKTFAYRGTYFESHGDYEVSDYYAAIEDGNIPSDYYCWWGYEDRKLFEFAKEKITAMAAEDEPFNFTMLTVDTHHPDGYAYEDDEENFPWQIENVIYRSDSQIAEFVQWVTEQDFYEDTVIVITGDHLSMSTTVENLINQKETDYERHVYVTIINSDTENNRPDENRLYTTMDLYPTTLSALGFNIEGNRLALGTDLYSGKDTLAEELGYEYFDDAMERRSDYYTDKILGQ